MKEYSKTTWKIIAIIFIILFTIETLFIVWSVMQVLQDEENVIECYYEVCAEYPDAYYDEYSNLCSCYNYDEYDNPFVTHEKIMN